MRRLLSYFGMAVAIACLAFFAISLSRHWQAISSIPLHGRLWPALAAATALYMLSYLFSAKSWQLVLRTAALPLGYLSAIRIVTISQFAKYIPGNVGHHIGRVLLAKKEGIPADVALSSMGVDAVLVLAAAALCSLAAFGLIPELTAHYGVAVLRTIVAIACVLTAAALVSLTSTLVRRYLAMALKQGSYLFHRGNRLTTCAAVLQNLCSFLLGTAALAIIVAGVGQLPAAALLNMLGIYSIAWLLGFLVPGAPAGLGVREAVLIIGLSPLLGQETATTSTALLRMTTVLGDGISLLVGLWMKRFLSP